MGMPAAISRFMALAVAHMERLVLGTVGSVVQAAIGEYAVHIENQQLHAFGQIDNGVGDVLHHGRSAGPHDEW